MLAAQAVGGARYTLEITVQYAKDREQFDKPLGAFQAISHYLADAATTVDGAETLMYEAAWARANGRSVDRLAPMAKLFACKTFRDVTAMSQQVFGGVGLHRRVRRAALLPPGQAAADLVVGRSGARGDGREHRARRLRSRCWSDSLARRADADAMTETIATAFFHDPLWSWAFADESRRAAQFRVWWRVFVDSCFRNEWTWVADDGASVAMWSPPGTAELTPADEEEARSARRRSSSAATTPSRFWGCSRSSKPCARPTYRTTT